MDAASLIEVGRVADAYGIKGWIRIEAYSGETKSEPVGLMNSGTWWLGRAQQAARPYKPEAVKMHSGAVVAKLEEIADRTAAEGLKGLSIWVPRSDFPAPGADEFYWVDLIGCDVTGADGAPLGRVERVDDNGAHAILEVLGGPSGRTHWIPFVNAYVKEVDITSKRIATEWLDSYSE